MPYEPLRPKMQAACRDALDGLPPDPALGTLCEVHPDVPAYLIKEKYHEG